MNIVNDNRTKLLMKNVILSFFVKGWSAVVVLLMVPLTLKMLGEYSNGVWLTISSILIWVDVMDIGLGNGLRNAVAEYIAKGDKEKVREAVSSTFFMLTVIVVPVLLLFCILIWTIDMYGALGVDSGIIPNLPAVLTVALSITFSTFILKAVGNFYMGLQLPAINNLIVCIGQTLALLFTFIAWMADCHSLMVVVLVNTLAPLLTWACSIPYTFLKKYPQYAPSLHLINPKLARNLCNTGVQFFVIQICGVVLFMTTNIIISKVFTPAEVTPYQVAYRYFHIAFVIFSIICMPFWNATTDAYAKGDIIWMKQASRKLNLLMLIIAVALVLMYVISDVVYDIWVGQGVEIPHELSASVAIYIFIICLSQRYSFILNGINVLRIQIAFTAIAAVTFLPLAWFVCKSYGTVTSLVVVMCIVNTPGMFANMWKYNRVIYHKKTS